MSSIISDLFFGSKQNILDNYLINRHEAQPSSLQQKQQTVLYASFIEFVITIPSINKNNHHVLLKIQVEMGNRSDEGFIEIKSGQKQSSSIILTLNELGKQDLNKYTNIKITISQGKYEKIHGFIPIQSIKNIASSFSNQKTITVQMKGKKSFAFSSVQCTIRTEFPNNNILNSELMRSLQKDQSYLKSKQEFSDQGNQTYSPKEMRNFAKKQMVRNRKNESSSNQLINIKKKSQNIVIEDQDQFKIINRKEPTHQKITEFVKQIKTIAISFTKIQLGQMPKVSDEQIRLKLGQRSYRLMQMMQIEHITREGINIEILFEDKEIGFIHLGPLLLTLDKIYGQLPIYSASQRCLGTIVVQSPLKKPFIQIKKPAAKQDSYQPTPFLKTQQESRKQLVLLSLDTIIMVNSNGSLNNSQDMDTSQINTYDFSKIQMNKIQVVVRINGIVEKFTDIVLNYTYDRQFMKSVELRRKQGFRVQYFELAGQQNLIIQIQIFSAYRLICYGKTVLKYNENFTHKFIAGDTQSNIFHCGVYLKAVRLQVQSQYFQQHKIRTIFDILQDILHKKIMITKLDDSQIKVIMNFHKKITYVEIKKLFVLIEKHIKQVVNFQQSVLANVYSKQKYEINEEMVKISGRLLQEFLYLDYNSNKMVTQDEFDKIIQFYKQNLQLALGQHFQEFIGNPIQIQSQIVFLFFVTGYYFIPHVSVIPSSSCLEMGAQNQQQKSKTTQKAHQVVSKVVQNIKEPTIQVEPSYFISKITIHNAHILNSGKAPNITLNLTKKISYSNSNPEFVIEKQVSLLQNISIYHKSIAQGRLISLAEFKPHRRQTYYELQASGKCFARIQWNL